MKATLKHFVMGLVFSVVAAMAVQTEAVADPAQTIGHAPRACALLFLPSLEW